MTLFYTHLTARTRWVMFFSASILRPFSSPWRWAKTKERKCEDGEKKSHYQMQSPPEHAGGNTCSIWPGNTSKSHRRRWKMYRKRICRGWTTVCSDPDKKLKALWFKFYNSQQMNQEPERNLTLVYKQLNEHQYWYKLYIGSNCVLLQKDEGLLLCASKIMQMPLCL